MIKQIKMTILYLFIIGSLVSCKKGELASVTETIVTAPLDTVKNTIPPVIDPVSTGPVVTIGTGSGILVLKNQEGKNFKITAGTYSGFQFENIKNCTVDGKNAAKIVGGGVTINTVNGLTLGGFSISNTSTRAVDIYNQANDLILKDIQISNVTDVTISNHINNKYDGTAASFSNNIQLLNIKADNILTFFASDGGISNSGFTGLIKNFVMKGCTITNSPNLSDGVWLPCAEDYVIANNVIDKVNASNNNHNGIFHLSGNGKIYNNKCTNHQGNMVRAWLFSITKAGVVEIYNNIVYNSTRYGAFELQVPPYIKAFSTFKPADAKVYNNTVGKLNTGLPKFFEGRLLDVYEMFGNIQVYNNLVFEDSDNIILNRMSADPITKNSDNIYKNTWSEAVSDLTSFRSLVPGVGAQ